MTSDTDDAFLVVLAVAFAAGFFLALYGGGS